MVETYHFEMIGMLYQGSSVPTTRIFFSFSKYSFILGYLVNSISVMFCSEKDRDGFFQEKTSIAIEVKTSKIIS